jgi:putative hydrolase of the HAD superfamily
MPHRTVQDPASRLGIDPELFRREWRAAKPSRMTSELSYSDALRGICIRLSHDPPAGAIDELAELRRRDKDSVFEVVDYDVLTMLGRVRHMGIRMGVVSNCSIDEVATFASTKLADLLDEVVWSFAEGVEKPDPEIYMRGCARLGVRPHECAFVGDGSFDELRGAESAGLTPLWASWFVRRWPADLAHDRRADVRAGGFREARTPSEVVRVVDGLFGRSGAT